MFQMKISGHHWGLQCEKAVSYWDNTWVMANTLLEVPKVLAIRPGLARFYGSVSTKTIVMGFLFTIMLKNDDVCIYICVYQTITLFYISSVICIENIMLLLQ